MWYPMKKQERVGDESPKEKKKLLQEKEPKILFILVPFAILPHL